MHDVTNQDMVTLLNEIGEQAVVAMVERGDGEEHDPIMEMLARKVQIINALADRVNEMSAVEFVEACEEICAGRKCYNCPLNNGFCTAHGIRLAVEIVKRWKEEQDGH